MFFSQVYNFTFLYSRDRGQKSLNKDTALALWEVLLPADDFAFTAQWLEFMEGQKYNVSKDTWQLLLDFGRKVGSDLGKHDEMDSWPYLVDEFVDWLKEKESEMS
eukprot:TRINITY_DN15603_c0_g1_i3.p1 TRINITY_DN15603_c0_g1~~TRINITY_DN15603_c0_g1_i3.p1  ORF type:complete len:105 (-),score=16.59 TRINITY_DN15603_c0_g1_i3:488-802(-)